jgi:hypothetical protein
VWARATFARMPPCSQHAHALGRLRPRRITRLRPRWPQGWPPSAASSGRGALIPYYTPPIDLGSQVVAKGKTLELVRPEVDVRDLVVEVADVPAAAAAAAEDKDADDQDEAAAKAPGRAAKDGEDSDTIVAADLTFDGPYVPGKSAYIVHAIDGVMIPRSAVPADAKPAAGAAAAGATAATAAKPAAAAAKPTTATKPAAVVPATKPAATAPSAKPAASAPVATVGGRKLKF